jgi:hypothetical protein
MLCQRPYLLQKQHKNYILYSLLLLYLLIIIKQRYGKAEQQSFRAAEVCTRPPVRRGPLYYYSMPPFGRGPSALLLHAPIWTRPFCTTAPCLHLDEALLHYCSLPSTGRGPFCKNFFCSRSSPLQNRQLYMLKDIANRQLSPISI